MFSDRLFGFFRVCFYFFFWYCLSEWEGISGGGGVGMGVDEYNVIIGEISMKF